MSLFEWAWLALRALFVLFLPGFAWGFVLLRNREAGVVARIAVSFGLSIILVPLSLYWLNIVLGVKVGLPSLVFTTVVLTAIPLGYLQVLKMKRAGGLSPLMVRGTDAIRSWYRLSANRRRSGLFGARLLIGKSVRWLKKLKHDWTR